MYEPLNTYTVPAPWQGAAIPASAWAGIELAATTAGLESVGRLRHEQLAEEEGRFFDGMDGCARIFLEPVDKLSLVFMARDEQETNELDACTASLRMTSADDATMDRDLAAMLVAADVALEDYDSTLVLSRVTMRSGGEARLSFPSLMSYAYDVALRNGFRRAVVAVHSKDASYFEGLGFVSTRHQISDSVAGSREVLVLDLLDRSQLLVVKSRLVAVLDQHRQEMDTAEMRLAA